MLQIAHRFKLVYVLLTKTTNTYILRALSPTIGSADIWRAILMRRHQLVEVTVPVTPTMFVEDSWVGTRVKPNVHYMPTVADAERKPSNGSQARAPREVPMHDTGVNGAGFIPGGPKLPLRVLGKGRVARPPQKALRLSYLKEGMNTFVFLTDNCQGTPRESSYR